MSMWREDSPVNSLPRKQKDCIKGHNNGSFSDPMEDLEQWEGTTLAKMSVVIKYLWEVLYWELHIHRVTCFLE